MNIFTKIKNFFNSSQNTSTLEAQKDLSLTVDPILKDFLENEVLNGLDVDANHFWSTFGDILEEFTPRNKELLQERESIQQQIDKWHIERKGYPIDKEEYKSFLKNIGYISESAADFQITTSNVDPEIAKIAGPQLVVPVMNARFALNAANARWGSMYDALYGTDVIAEDNGAEKVGGYNPVRGDKVIAFAKNFLDEIIPLIDASHKDVVGFTFDNNSLSFKLNNGGATKLNDQSKYIGYADYGNDAFGLLFKNNLLHFEISVDPHHSIGQEDPASIKDIIIESAITTIQDCEDSVAAVDGEDKTTVYRNWLGLMRGDLEETFNKGGSPLTRKLEGDRDYIDLEGNNFSLPGRSLMLVRNVGHLMQNPAILDKNGDEVFEGIMDAMFTICIAKHDLMNLGKYSNSRTGSVYIVKPKMHGPKEVKFTCDLFAAVEKALNIEPLSIKVGIMDEERRTTVNLKECIEVAKDRVIFINTGFLDRTGDEIHTSMEAGPMLRKGDIKLHKWIAAYENWNVDTGLETGFKGKAQIGKGMWPMPDEMLGMLQQKTIHPEAGANCAWVPSPTAASIHAIHYHQINVADVQDNLLQRQKASLDDILSIPLLEDASSLSQEDIQNELDNNTQGILGYVVRWVDQGVGCSKVPDINDIGLMEDRATCRISSQHIANWLYHGICKEDQVIESMKKMAVKVDEQNSGDPLYKNMSPNFDGHAFKAACSLAIDGRVQPSGYTEPILHNMRLKFKSQ